MSQASQIRLAEVKEWLNKTTASQIEPLRNKANGVLKGIKERINDTVDSSQKILENSQNEMDKNNPKTHRFARNANKFAESLIGTLEGVKIPENVQYVDLQAFCDELEKTCSTVDQLRRSAYPYISPYFIFDRRRLDVFAKRLYDMTKELRVFLTQRYADVKTVDDAHSYVDKLTQTLSETKKNEQELEVIEARMRELEQEISGIKDKLLQVRSRAELAELVKLDQRITELRAEAKQSLRYLQKPFYKLQSLSRASQVAVPPDEIHKLDEYLEDPLIALTNEDDSYSTLKSILRRLDDTISQGKLKLKSTRLRKAQDQIDAVLNKNSLSQLQKQGQETLSHRKQMLMSNELKQLQAELTQLQQQLETRQKDYEIVASQSKSLKTDQTRLKQKEEDLKKELEKKVSHLARKNVEISLP